MQNPGWRAGASRDQLGGCSLPVTTATDRQAQLLAGRFLLPPPLRASSHGTVSGRLAMTDAFPNHRAAALALLTECPDLPHKAAGFLGHVCVAPELSERQRDWLVKLLDRHDLPALAEGAAR
jgi:hypothetical protein